MLENPEVLTEAPSMSKRAKRRLKAKEKTENQRITIGLKIAKKLEKPLQINKVDGFGKSKKVVDMPKSIILVMPDGSKALTRKEVEIAELKKQNETRKIKAERYRRIAYFSILQSEDCKDNPEKHKTKGLGNYPFGNFNQFMTKWHCQHDKNYPNYVSWQRTSIYNNGKRAQIPRPRTCSHKVLNWVESQKRRDKIRNGLLDIKSERFATNNDTEIEKPRVKSEFLK